MNNATPVPMLAVEPVLMFRASCHCGWQTITADEPGAQVAVIQHLTHTRCDGCLDDLDHDAMTVHPQGSWVGSFCAFCAPLYAPAA